VNDESKDPAVRVVDRRWWAQSASATAAEEPVRKPSYVEELEGRLADSTAHLQKVMAEHRRGLEEFEEAKHRIRREVSRDIERGRRAILADMLEVLDNLDRAIASARSADGTASADTLVKGVEMVRDQFLAKLAACNVTRIVATGTPFDARCHEAISTTPVENPEADGTVVAVIREGYTVGDELLRPAAVVVGAFAVAHE
jgi:molecular chaperone GrpE